VPQPPAAATYPAPSYPPVDPYAQPVAQPPAAQPDVYAAPTYQPAAYQAPAYQAPAYQAPGYQQPVYQQPTYQQPTYAVPAQYDPLTGQPLSDKSKVVAGLLQIFLGSFAVGRFYTGHTSIALAQLGVVWGTFALVCCGGFALSVVTFGLGSFAILLAPLGSLWPFIDGIMLLTKGGTDAQGRVLRSS
jgi:TM2 domain-containing membrane protein YozV